MNDKPAVTVRDDPERGVFLALLDDGTEAGGAYYERSGDVVSFDHTEVPSELEGQGVGSALARGALDTVRARGERIVVKCPFIRAYLERHPEYQDLRADRG
ncbi:GNAT family N-acetyltransferase [Isoptericola sediminis]|uniref:N-acetyltransferase n=1 Tax=Isoptericola sediminis TaxID=2733572 RepID=A0A849JWG7_9MICO|nr:GNAT family N-acetyltransferase [Isoptericola sediminis]NNU27666.1 N-acetyltransferase [Isoptericola sediminis]